MIILGVSAFYHDSAAALIVEGEIVAAVQEERFTRIKHDNAFPVNAIMFCLKQAGISFNQVEGVAFYDKPFIKFERLMMTYLSEAPKGFNSFRTAIPVWIKQKLFLKKMIIDELGALFSIKKNKIIDKLFFNEHHMSHAASAFYPSPFKSAAILTLDGVGEWSTTSLAYGENQTIKILKELKFPHSIGLLYSAFTHFTGFKVNSGEYKVMGLAPYGEPKYVDKIRDELIDIKDDGSFHLNMKYFSYLTGLSMTNKKFETLFEMPARKKESPIENRHLDLARSIQEVTQEIIIKIAKNAKIETGSNNLCLAGGVALNCVANGQILLKKIFKNIWIQPAAGDAGGALGAALSVYHMEYAKKRTINSYDSMKGSFLGPSYSNGEVERYFKNIGAVYEKYSDVDQYIDLVSDLISQEKIVGWHQGKSEFGPRALGARSILGDARSSTMQSKLNLKIKFRESFRPFAPSVLNECAGEYFKIDCSSPYMLFVAEIQDSIKEKNDSEDKKVAGLEKLKIKRSSIPAVTHVDCSARVQTVHKKTNSKYYKLIKKFKEKTGCAVVVNTSFNVRGEPIVCSPEDSFRCFMRTDMDVLAIENFILYKEKQPKFELDTDWIQEFELD